MAGAPSSAYPQTGPVATNQLADTNSMMGNLIKGQPMSPQQSQQTTQQYGQATNQLATMQTPGARQDYINNSNVPALQGNYDQLAQQLFEYDKNVASPNYSAITPSAGPAMPTDQSPLALTMGTLGANNFSFNNPNLAISSQTAQKNNINDLLSTLNSSISREFSNRQGQYASTVKSQQTYLDSLLKVLELNQQLVASQNKGGGSVGRDVANEKAAIAKRIASSGQIGGDGKLSPAGYQAAKQMAMSEYGWSPQDFDSEFGAFVNDTHRGDYGVTSTAAQTKASGAEQQKATDTQSTISSLGSVYKSFQKLGPLGTFNLLDQNDKKNYDNQRRIFADSMAKALGLNRNGAQVNAIMNTLPATGVGSEGAFRGVVQQILDKNGLVLVKDISGNIGLEYGQYVDPNQETTLDPQSVDLGTIFGQ